MPEAPQSVADDVSMADADAEAEGLPEPFLPSLEGQRIRIVCLLFFPCRPPTLPSPVSISSVFVLGRCNTCVR
jgi:hypothetical protein